MSRQRPEASNSPVAISRAVEYVTLLAYKAICSQCGKVELEILPPHRGKSKYYKALSKAKHNLIDAGWVVIEKKMTCRECAAPILHAKD